MLNVQIEYGGHVVDFNKAPMASIEALLRRGVAHYLGNEQAAKITGWKERLAKGEDGKPGREPSEDEIAMYKGDLVSTALADLYAGEIGSGRGPRLDPVERELRSIVDSHIANTLAGNGIKFPKGRKLPGPDEIIVFTKHADGTPDQTRTLDQMRENVMRVHGEKFKKDAEKRVKELVRRAEQAKAEAAALAAKGPVSADAIGL